MSKESFMTLLRGKLGEAIDEDDGDEELLSFL